MPAGPVIALGSHERWTCAEAMHRALAALVAGRAAVAIPLLCTRDCVRLSRVAESCPCRPAERVVGSGGRQVLQAFEICMDIAHPLIALTDDIARLISECAGRMQPPPCPRIAFNDLTLQRYPAGPYGITPHRDHRDYRYLVGVVVLTGRARFLVCDDRAGRNAREVPASPGHLVLMRAPGFAGSDQRPFHAIVDVASPRISLGMRCLAASHA